MLWQQSQALLLYAPSPFKDKILKRDRERLEKKMEEALEMRSDDDMNVFFF